jgi:hypothetical protein
VDEGHHIDINGFISGQEDQLSSWLVISRLISTKGKPDGHGERERECLSVVSS